MTTCGVQGVSSTQFTDPSGVCYTGSKLIVKDGTVSSWSRLLIWNSLPTSNGQAADQVIGQANFTTNVTNYLGLTQNSYYAPQNLYCDSNRIYIPDMNNNRALAIPVP